MTLLDVQIGDLAAARADAIATSTSVDLKVGGGVNGAIHAAAGPELASHCAQLGQCPVAEARTTPPGRLGARHVIHGVAPRWKDGQDGEAQLLAALYGAIIAEAVRHDCRTLALPSFGTGAFGAPADTAANIACAALAEALVGDWGDASTRIRLVRFWVANPETREAYRSAIDHGSARLRPVRWDERPFRNEAAEPTSATRPIAWSSLLDEDDFTLLRAGLPALDMNEKWWAFWSGSHLRIFRSWTGYEIFSLRARPRPDGAPGAVLDQLHVCDDRTRYTDDDRQALEALHAVLRMILRR